MLECVPKTNIKNLMKNMQQNAIKYLTYLVLNTRKLANKQTPIPCPHVMGNYQHPIRAHLPKRQNTLSCITEYRDQHEANMLTFTPILKYGRTIYLFI